jgi:tRNA dimethylallyltransferase
MELRLPGSRPQRSLAERLGARFVERLARVAAERPRLFRPAPDKRKSVLHRRAIVVHAAPVEAGDEKSGRVSGSILFLAGPTASGKSALALGLAEAVGGEIVNADSMQVYRDLDVVTARPFPEDLARAPHHLYGHVDAAQGYSVGRWAGETVARLTDIAARGKPAIVVGGTGLYFKALTDGLADVPDPGPEAEAFARDLLNTHGVDALRALAVQLDPKGAARVSPTDRQRLLRLVAVARGVGQPLSELRAATTPPALPGAWRGLVLEPDRAYLARRIDSRAHRMIEEGGPEEAARLVARGLPPELPAMKAIGVSTLAAFERGLVGKEETLERLAGDTRRYAKRQLTWFRHQTADWPRLGGLGVEAALAAWRGQDAR